MEAMTLQHLQRVAQSVMPSGSEVWLYGSRARGTNRADSDWDILILLDKEKLLQDDFGKVGYPFEEMAWDFDECVSPVLYTKHEWAARKGTPFYQNVEHDKIRVL